MDGKVKTFRLVRMHEMFGSGVDVGSIQLERLRVSHPHGPMTSEKKGTSNRHRLKRHQLQWVTEPSLLFRRIVSTQ